MVSILFSPKIVTIAVIVFFCFGCGPGLLEGPIPSDTEEQDMVTEHPNVLNDSEMDTEKAFPVENGEQWSLCPPNTDKSCHFDVWLPRMPSEIVSARWLSEPAHFTHMGLNVLLGYETRNTEPVPIAIYVDFSKLENAQDFSDRAIISTLPDEIDPQIDWVGVVVGNNQMIGSSFYEIAAFYQNEEYQLVGIPSSGGSNTLQPISPNTLGTSAALHKLVYLQSKTELIHSSLDRICLFGAGLFCFDGSRWTAEILPAECQFITAVGVTEANDAPVIVAVDENGQAYVKQIRDSGEGSNTIVATDSDSNSDSDSEINSNPEYSSSTGWTTLLHQNSDAALHALTTDAAFDSFTAAGNGFLIYGNANGENQQCKIEPDVLSINYYLGTHDFLILATDGTLYGGTFGAQDDGYLCNSGLQFEEAIDGISFERNYYILSPSALYGGVSSSATVAE